MKSLHFSTEHSAESVERFSPNERRGILGHEGGGPAGDSDYTVSVSTTPENEALC